MSIKKLYYETKKGMPIWVYPFDVIMFLVLHSIPSDAFCDPSDLYERIVFFLVGGVVVAA